MSKDTRDKIHFPPFVEAAKNLTQQEILQLAETTYKLEVTRLGGVIDE